jgi:hypothetical protein
MHQFLRGAPREAVVQLAIIGKYGMGPQLHYLSRLVTSDGANIDSLLGFYWYLSQYFGVEFKFHQ